MLVDLHAIESRYCVNVLGLMLVNVFMKFHEEITDIVRVVAPEIKFC